MDKYFKKIGGVPSRLSGAHEVFSAMLAFFQGCFGALRYRMHAMFDTHDSGAPVQFEHCCAISLSSYATLSRLLRGEAEPRVGRRRYIGRFFAQTFL